MIKFTIELWPYGEDKGRTPLLLGDIWNDGTGTKTVGNYNYQLFESRGGAGMSVRRKPHGEGHIEGFYRSRGAAALVKAILDDFLEGRAPKVDLRG